MSRKLTADEWEQRAKAQEERARQSRRKAKEQRIAEKAKVDAEILAAVKEWWDAVPEDQRKPYKELAPFLREQAAKRREHFSVGEAEAENGEDVVDAGGGQGLLRASGTC